MCLLYVSQWCLAQGAHRQHHISSAGRAPRQTEMWASFPRSFHMPSGHGRRPRNSAEKIHACDSPGCGKKFYERCTLFRHQRLKHGRQTKFTYTTLSTDIGAAMVVLPHSEGQPSRGDSLPPPQSSAVQSPRSEIWSPSQRDAIPPSQSVALSPSQSVALSPSHSDSLLPSQSNAEQLSQRDALSPSQTDSVQVLQSNPVHKLQNNSMPLSHDGKS